MLLLGDNYDGKILKKFLLITIHIRHETSDEPLKARV